MVPTSRAEDYSVLFDAWLVLHLSRRTLDDALSGVGISGDDFALYHLIEVNTSLTPTQIAHWTGMPTRGCSSRRSSVHYDIRLWLTLLYFLNRRLAACAHYGGQAFCRFKNLHGSSTNTPHERIKPYHWLLPLVRSYPISGFGNNNRYFLNTVSVSHIIHHFQ